jgi:methylmalonyl-CoA/ethylmalonyl-CoA epimerase
MELFEPRNSVLLPEARRHPNSDVQLHGNKHVAFRTNNIRVLIEWFRSNEVEFALELSSAFGDAVFIRDNAGNLIEFLCRRRSLPEK